MGKAVKYVNLTNMPVYVPGPRGVQVLFAPNQGTFDPWFSRFIGPRRLSKVEVDTDQVNLPKGIVPTTQAQVVETGMGKPEVKYEKPPFKVAPVQIEETDNWIKKNGVYYCRHCDEFATGSREVINSHVMQVHQMEATTPPIRHRSVNEELGVPDVPPPSPRPVQTEAAKDDQMTSPASPVDTGDASTPEDDAEPTPVTKKTPAATEKTESKPQKGYICDVCGKTFKTTAGLGGHKRAKHSPKK